MLRVTGSCHKKEPVTFSDTFFTVLGCYLSHPSNAVRRRHDRGNLQIKRLVGRLLVVAEGWSIADAWWWQVCMVLEHSRELTSDPKDARKERERGMDLVWASETSKPTPVVHLFQQGHTS